MKLVELLVKELVKWPECVTYFVQDGNGDVKAGSGSKLREPLASRIWIRGTALDGYNFYPVSLCTDWKTSIVTKDIYTKHKEGMLLTQQTQMKRKVREDFNPAKDYSVDVSECTEDGKEEVQQAFFDVGIKWEVHGEEYKYMGAVKYTNKERYENVTTYLMHGSSTKGCNMTAKEFLALVYEPEEVGHVHAELMLRYAEDAKTTDKPWELWQVKGEDGIWFYCSGHPMWRCATEYRHKPKTKLIHGVEIPVFEFTPKVGEKYYAANVGLPELFEQGYRSSECCTFTQRMIERGLIYPCTEGGKQAAILHSKAMLGIAYLSNAHHTHN